MVMNKFYTQTFYCNDGEITVDRMVIVCATPEEAADKAIDKLARKYYTEDLEVLCIPVENDAGEDCYVYPGVFVTTGGYGDEVDGEEVEREYAKYFSLEDIIL